MGFFEGYFAGKTTIIPNVSWKTILGTGITSGVSGNGVAVNVDGGYLRLYVAFGLPLAIVFYVFLYYKLFRAAKSMPDSRLKNVLLLFLVIIIIGEFKEYVIFQQYMLCIFYTAAILASMDAIKKEKTMERKCEGRLE